MNQKEIEAYLKALPWEQVPEALGQLADDQRKSIQTLLQRWQKKLEQYKQEQRRLQLLWQYEQQAWENGCLHVAGTDEVGRGPLAGPVVAAAVILPADAWLPGINDSKKLSEKKRMELEKEIKAQALAYAVVEIDEKTIDRINILEASRLAMATAVQQLTIQPDLVLVDGLPNPRIILPSQAIIKGDSKSISIAAASILAKVYRDQLMDGYGNCYPQYGFAEHKGYPTAKHIAAIEQYGPCPIHRMSFKPLCKSE